MSIINIISKIRKGKIWDFHGGLHPDEHKRESSETPLVDAGIPLFWLFRSNNIAAESDVCWLKWVNVY